MKLYLQKESEVINQSCEEPNVEEAEPNKLLNSLNPDGEDRAQPERQTEQEGA